MTIPVRIRVADVCDLGDGAHASVRRRTSGIPYLTSKNIGQGELKLDSLDYISEEDYERLFPPVSKSVTRLREGDVLTGIIGTFSNSYVYRSSDTFGISSAIAVLRPNKSYLSSKYLYYYLNTPQLQSLKEAVASGSVQGYTNLTVLGSLPLILPPLEEQQAIAEVLGALDDKIAANTQLVATSALLAQSLFATAATDTHGIEIGLADSCSLLSRGITPKYSTDDETMVVLNQKCVRGQRVDLAPARRTLLAKGRQEKELLQNDVLVNSTGQGTLGRIARWTHDARATVDSHITIVRFNPEVIDPVCGGFAMLRNEENITAMAEGSTGQTELSRVELGKLRLRLPLREQQQALGRQLAKMTSMENAHLLESQTLAKTRDALLPRLMSGQLSVKEAEALVTASI